VDESLANWFSREILPLENDLLRYLLRAWPRRTDVEDLRQEIYLRVYQGARENRPQSPRGFLFKTAHHLLIDRVRHERIVSIEATGGIDELNVLVDEISPEQRVGARQELKRLARAFDTLPPRCREVIWMRRVLDISQKEVAKQLGVQEKAIEKQVARGVRLLAEQMLSSELIAARPNNQQEQDSEHGKQP
jgi:RNA polymerase sigma-70 factor (ECF subfamily)